MHFTAYGWACLLAAVLWLGYFGVSALIAYLDQRRSSRPDFWGAFWCGFMSLCACPVILYIVLRGMGHP